MEAAIFPDKVVGRTQMLPTTLENIALFCEMSDAPCLMFYITRGRCFAGVDFVLHTRDSLPCVVVKGQLDSNAMPVVSANRRGIYPWLCHTSGYVKWL